MEKSPKDEIAEESERLYREFLPYLEAELEKARGGGTLVLCLTAQDQKPDYLPRQQASESIVSEIIAVLKAEAHVDGFILPYDYENVAIICRDKNRSDFADQIDLAIPIIGMHEFGKGLPLKNITMSFGLSSFPFDSEHPEQLVQQARLALKAAQEAGGNSMGCFWMLNATPFPPIYP